MKVKTLYTAHTFNERYYVRDVICRFLQSIGVRTLNPFYEPDGRVRAGRLEVAIADELEKRGIDPRKDIKWARQVKRKSGDIVTKDLGDINNADGIVAYMQEWSGGTTCEIFYCGHVCKKPVFLITQNTNIANHPWMVEACNYGGKIFRSFRSFKRYMKKHYA